MDNSAHGCHMVTRQPTRPGTAAENLVLSWPTTHGVGWLRADGDGRQKCHSLQVHGTRNVRNTVKALIQGFESQTIPDEEAHLPIVKLEKQQRKRVKGVATVQTAGLLSI